MQSGPIALFCSVLKGVKDGTLGTVCRRETNSAGCDSSHHSNVSISDGCGTLASTVDGEECPKMGKDIHRPIPRGKRGATFYGACTV